jgi:thiol-disulfide isomerase/thioredoxin
MPRHRGEALKSRRRIRTLRLITAAACAALFGIAGLRAAEGAAETYLLGLVQSDQILKISADWKAMYDASSPAAASVERIRAAAEGAKGDFRIVVVFGSWCDDSLQHVPRFIKIAQEVGTERLPESYLGVDRSKKDPEGRVAGLKIEKVPTFIVYRKDAEIGRIVETPKATLEEDLAEILSPSAKK